MAGKDYFSKSYGMARSRFIAAACTAGGRMDELHLDAMGPGGLPLAIEIAWFGADEPERVLIHSSGIHGVEGFAGSAIQLAVLEQGITVPDDNTAVIIVHCLNPYGMAWLRRVNENNVDLNRNYIMAAMDRCGAADTYRELDPLLNPQGRPRVLDWFYPKAARSILKYGMPALRQAIAEGQYEYPRGLFYGGDDLQKGVLLYLGWLSIKLKSVRRVFAIDVHTGLGKWGEQSLFLRVGREQPLDVARIAKALGHPVVEDSAANGAYEIRGMLSDVFDILDPRPEWTFILQEFGTYPAIRVLNALRKENQWSRNDIGLDHPSRKRLKRMFAPDNAMWRESVVKNGVSLYMQAIEYAFA